MTSTVTTGPWQRFDHAEHALCLRVNRGCHHVPTRRLFVTVSRLGDGILWYVLMLAFALSGPQGAFVAAQMAVAGLAGTALYRQLKHRLVRNVLSSPTRVSSRAQPRWIGTASRPDTRCMPSASR